MHDEAAPVPAEAPPGGSPAGARRRAVDLRPDEALRLLSGVPLGRIVFTEQALPAVRPVNHVVDGGDVVIRTAEGAALARRAREAGTRGVVVAYEADEIDAAARLGWSVVVTGYCRLVTDPEETARYAEVLRPWTDQHREQVVRIRPDLVTGVRLVAAD
ncbi:pyridoxamine 5'-phosphate oxidase family protein [Streptomyces griseus]|uniref:pyridoxamine 5'-phosphate oxidase family protein n=1 Tax=Streptomyces griseus TaxID=1911 RepID=UPI0004CB6A6A|nr:pyridoxamine 5'-phosphate oxidase family protein [Streptomyces griseus]